jgi:hypothetical protein
MKAGRLTRTPSTKVRGRALVDLMKGLQLLAKAGVAREQLLEDARSYVPPIPGKQIQRTSRRGYVWTSAKSPMHSRDVPRSSLPI